LEQSVSNLGGGSKVKQVV